MSANRVGNWEKYWQEFDALVNFQKSHNQFNIEIAYSANMLKYLTFCSGLMAHNATQLEGILTELRVALSEEKTARSKAETMCANQQTELTFKSEMIEELRAQLDYANGSGDALSTRVSTTEIAAVRSFFLRLHFIQWGGQWLSELCYDKR